MALGSIRPRFRVTVAPSVDDAIAQVCAAAGVPERRCVSRVLGAHVDITVVREDRHRWSPCIQLEFRAGEHGTIVDGLVGPHPNVWTLFAFVNITLLTAAGFGLLLGLVQWSLGLRAWGLWAAAIGAALLVVSYLASQAGRHFAAEQSHALLALVEEALDTTLPRFGDGASGKAAVSD